jgi:hypothetical protein
MHLPRIKRSKKSICHGRTRNKNGKEGKPLSVIFANAEIHIYSKARMDPAYARVTKARGGVNKLRSEAFATDEHGKEGKPLSVIFANAEIHTNSKARMGPRIREGD